MYRIVIRRRAEVDLAGAVQWYSQRREGLQVRLLKEFQDALDRISEHPEAYRVVVKDTRRVLLKTFPYMIYFRLRGSSAVVLRFLHAHRDPEAWTRH